MSNPRPRFKRELVRFLKFSVVGTIGAVVDFGTFNLLNSVLGVWYLLAGSLSFLAAVSSNFVWNRLWTYPDSRSKPIGRQAFQFLIVNAVGLAIRAPVLALTEQPMIRLADGVVLESPFLASMLTTLHLPLDATIIGRNLSLALAVILVLFWNFIINRLWTYSDAP